MRAATASLAIALGLAVLLRTASAHANGLGPSTCATFGVRHSANPREDNTKNVTLELLLDNGTVTNCFNPQQDYWGKQDIADRRLRSMNFIICTAAIPYRSNACTV